ncbi:MAG: hypothetical protein AB8G86_14150 [Saprospiraceae bacterium]
MEAGKQTYEIKWKLANSYRLNSEYEAAEYWYAQIINDAQDSETILHYAQMLQANGKCEDAIRWYKDYAAKSQQDSRSFIEDCTELKQFTNHTAIQLENMVNLNSEYHDFSPVPYQNGLVFTSMRSDENAFNTNIDPWTNSNFSDLFYAKKSQDGFEKPTTLKGAVNGGYYDGVVTFNPIGKQMIFTRTSNEKSSKNPTKKLKYIMEPVQITVYGQNFSIENQGFTAYCGYPRKVGHFENITLVITTSLHHKKP